ncbi:MAG: hypothetical protein LBB88_11520 [Planctomycetaceae bacterium]|jgi:hypothetical protein|nr:hypothetical protein [Planctomycetaceae bacterium]
MKKMIVSSLIAALFCVASTLNAQEAKEEAVKEIKLTKVNYVSAAKIDFKKELGVAFPGLLSLGVRIEQAAKDLDPVGLVAAGLELKAAESAAGKTAAQYKADDVIKRGLDLALLRGEQSELKALKSLLPDNAEKLDKAIKVAEAAKNETDRATNWYVTIVNRHGEDVDVVVDGRNKGTIRANRIRTIHVHIHDCVWLRVLCSDDGDVIREQELHDDGGTRNLKIYVD